MGKLDKALIVGIVAAVLVLFGSVLYDVFTLSNYSG